jgi:hypothetical protein
MNELIFKEPPSMEIIKKNARAFFDKNCANGEKEYDEPRGCLNYLRHEHTNYDKLRYAIRVSKQEENNNLEVLTLKLAVHRLISERYPSYGRNASGKRSGLISG